jgi:hypothetical protein
MATHKWINHSLWFFAALLLVRGSVANGGLPTPTLRETLLRVAAVEVATLGTRLPLSNCRFSAGFSTPMNTSPGHALKDRCAPPDGKATCHRTPPASPACSLKETDGVGAAAVRSHLTGRAVRVASPRLTKPRRTGGARLLWLQAAASSLNVRHVRLQI